MQSPNLTFAPRTSFSSELSGFNRQSSATYSRAFDHHEHNRQVLKWDSVENVLKSFDGLSFAVVPTAEQDHARASGLRQRQESRIVQVGGEHHSPLCSCSLQDFAVGSTVETKVGGMNSLMALLVQPLGQLR